MNKSHIGDNQSSYIDLMSTYIKRQSRNPDDQSGLKKALSTYLNVTGPGDYNIKSFIGTQIVEGVKKSSPSYSIKQKTKITWFPEHGVVRFTMLTNGIGLSRKRLSKLYQVSSPRSEVKFKILISRF